MEWTKLPVIIDLLFSFFSLSLSLLFNNWIWCRVKFFIEFSSNFLLKELQVFSENFNSKSIQINCLAHSLLDSSGLFLHFSIFLNHICLDFLHLWIQAFNCDQFIIWISLLNDVEYFENFMVLILHINESQFLSLVFTDKIYQLTTLFDFIKTLDKLVGKRVNPFNKLILNIN